MKTYTIATIGKVTPDNHAWFKRMSTGIQKFGQETKHKTFLVGPPKADEKLQVQVLEDIIAQGVDALCVVPVFPEALEWPLRKAKKQGIVVISHEASDQRNVDYDLEAFDNAAFGAHLMDHLAKYMGEEGQYSIFIGSLTAKSHDEWSKAAITHQTEEYPEMSMVSRKLEDHDDPALAYKNAEELISSYPKLKGILAIGMTACAGVGRRIEEKKLQDNIMVVGNGLVSVSRQHLLSNATKLISFWDPADAGYAMNTLAVTILEGKSVSEGMDLGVPGYTTLKMQEKVLFGSAMIDVTKENMADYNF